MPDLTPEEIQQARELGATWIKNEYSTGDDDTDRDFSLFARAVLALVEDRDRLIAELRQAREMDSI
jgi:hypothetical protein